MQTFMRRPAASAARGAIDLVDEAGQGVDDILSGAEIRIELHQVSRVFALDVLGNGNLRAEPRRRQLGLAGAVQQPQERIATRG